MARSARLGRGNHPLAHASSEASATVARALEHPQHAQVDLVLFDIHLPDGSGLDVLHWLPVSPASTHAKPTTATPTVPEPQTPAADEKTRVPPDGVQGSDAAAIAP